MNSKSLPEHCSGVTKRMIAISGKIGVPIVEAVTIAYTGEKSNKKKARTPTAIVWFQNQDDADRSCAKSTL